MSSVHCAAHFGVRLNAMLELSDVVAGMWYAGPPAVCDVTGVSVVGAALMREARVEENWCRSCSQRVRGS